METKIENNFDTLMFKKYVDSSFQIILDFKITPGWKFAITELKIDTLLDNKKSGFYPFINSSLYTIKYTFISPSPRRLGHKRVSTITVYESFFKDSILANEQFKITKEAGSKNAPDTISSAGLSYTYDYLIKHKDRIFLLNAPCGYSNRNFKKLIPIFKNSFKINVPEDTISCTCGGYCI